MKDGVIDLENTRHVSSDDFSKWTRRVVPRGGDVVFSYETRLGQAAMIPHGLECCLGRRMGLIRLDHERVDPNFFVYQYIAKPFRTFLDSRTIRGATVDRISIKEFPNFPIYLPSIDVQKTLVEKFGMLQKESFLLEDIFERKLAAIAELKQSILQKAFAGELTKDFAATNISTMPAKAKGISEIEFHAGILAIAFQRHEAHGNQKTFGRVKGQKYLHLVESIGGIDLGRNPIKDAAGPNDFPHMLRAEDWAKQNQFFEFVPRPSGGGYDFKKLARFDEHLDKATTALKFFQSDLKKVVDLLLDMDTDEAELFATVHSAWNNLIIDRKPISDQAIIREAREGWHSDKLRIPVERFNNALNSIRTRRMEPDGSAKYVGGQQHLI